MVKKDNWVKFGPGAGAWCRATKTVGVVWVGYWI